MGPLPQNHFSGSNHCPPGGGNKGVGPWSGDRGHGSEGQAASARRAPRPRLGVPLPARWGPPAGRRKRQRPSPPGSVKLHQIQSKSRDAAARLPAFRGAHPAAEATPALASLLCTAGPISRTGCHSTVPGQGGRRAGGRAGLWRMRLPLCHTRPEAGGRTTRVPSLGHGSTEGAQVIQWLMVCNASLSLRPTWAAAEPHDPRPSRTLASGA